MENIKKKVIFSNRMYIQEKERYREKNHCYFRETVFEYSL